MQAGHGPRPDRLPTLARLESIARRYWAWAVAAAVLSIVLLALRQPLAERLWPQAPVDRALAEGHQALAEGRLDRADGQGARQKFEAALALDSDRGEARDGLAQVGQAALDRARAAIGQARFAEARRWLALAGELEVPRPQVQAVQAQLLEAETADADLPALRVRAGAALAAGDVEGALALHAQWLAFEPGDSAALEGREDALSLLLERVPPALQAGDLAGAARWLSQARRYDPGHVDLPAAQAAYTQALDLQVREAGRQLQRGRLQAAAERFLRLREAAPDDSAVIQGARATAQALAAQAGQLAEDFHFDEAERALALAHALAADAPGLEEAARDLQRARQAAARLGAPAQAVRAGTLRRTLQEFDAALQRGDWITPPGASAYDRLRAAQAVAPADRAVRDAAVRLQAAVAACVQESMRDNRLRRAQDCLATWQALEPGDPELAESRLRLAQRWLAVGEERLRAGELQAATRALDAARDLEPRMPGLEDFAGRVASARGTAR